MTEDNNSPVIDNSIAEHGPENTDKQIVVNRMPRAGDPGRAPESQNSVSSAHSEPSTEQRTELVHHHSVIESTHANEPSQQSLSSSGPEPADKAVEAEYQPKPNNTEEESSDSNDGLVNEFAKQAMGKNGKEQEQSEEEATKQNLEGLIENKTYFVPVGQITHQRNKHLLVVAVVSVVLVIAGVLYFLAIK